MPERVQLKRTKGWRMPPNTVKVDRSTKWGNPFALRQPYRTDGASTYYVTSREQAWYLFDRAMVGTLPPDYKHADVQSWQLFADRAKRELRGKNLACWCPLDEPCHAEVLLRIANESEKREGTSE